MESKINIQNKPIFKFKKENLISSTESWKRKGGYLYVIHYYLRIVASMPFAVVGRDGAGATIKKEGGDKKR